LSRVNGFTVISFRRRVDSGLPASVQQGQYHGAPHANARLLPAFGWVSTTISNAAGTRDAHIGVADAWQRVAPVSR
jgi:hypothetical protein